MKGRVLQKQSIECGGSNGRVMLLLFFRFEQMLLRKKKLEIYYSPLPILDDLFDNIQY